MVIYSGTERHWRIGIPNIILQSCDNLLAYNSRSSSNFAVTYFFFLFVGLPDDSSNYVLHVSNRMPLNAVRWNPGNQDEVRSRFILHVYTADPFFTHYEIFLFSSLQFQFRILDTNDGCQTSLFTSHTI